MKKERNKRSPWDYLYILLMVAVIVMIPEMSDPPPENQLFVEQKRADYESGDLHLTIPRMGVDDNDWIYVYEQRDTKITESNGIQVLYLQEYPYTENYIQEAPSNALKQWVTIQIAFNG